MSALFLTNCKGLPKWPEELDTFHVFEFPNSRSHTLDAYTTNLSDVVNMRRSNEYLCLKYAILEKNPIKVQFVTVDNVEACDGLSGYEPSSFQIFLNWVQKAFEKFEPKSEDETP